MSTFLVRTSSHCGPALHAVTIASHSIGSKYISNERQDALQKRIQGACKWRKWLRHARAFPVGLTTYGSLAIDDDRCVSNEIECLAHEYHDDFTIPCAFFFSCYFAPSQTCEPNLDNARPRSCSDASWRCLCSHHLFETFL